MSSPLHPSSGSASRPSVPVLPPPLPTSSAIDCAKSQIEGRGGSAHAGGIPKSGNGREKLGGNGGSPGIWKPQIEAAPGTVGAKLAAAAAAS